MEEILISVGEEQKITVGNYTVSLTFDPFNKEWHYDMLDNQNNYLLKNVVLKVNCSPLNNIADRLDYPVLCLIDKEPKSKVQLNPYTDFGDRLGLFEITGA